MYNVVSVMAANSETGVINPVREAARLAHGHGALFHCDATQAIGRIPFDARETDIDMVTLSSHKIYGPKGAGALVATREARKRLAAVMSVAPSCRHSIMPPAPRPPRPAAGSLKPTHPTGSLRFHGPTTWSGPASVTRRHQGGVLPCACIRA